MSASRKSNSNNALQNSRSNEDLQSQSQTLMDNIPWIQSSQQVLSQLIKKAPLTAKLLSKPPFRYLHDLIGELCEVANLSIEGIGEFTSEALQEKDGKIAYLARVIKFIESRLGTGSVSAKPTKIVAGKEPEFTNQLLVQLAQLAISNQFTNTTPGVSASSDNHGEQTEVATESAVVESVSVSSNAGAAGKPKSATSSKQTRVASAKSTSKENLSKGSSSKSKVTTAAPVARKAVRTSSKPTAGANVADPAISDDSPALDIDGMTSASRESLGGGVAVSAEEAQPVTKLARPTTARLGPPKPKKITAAPPTESSSPEKNAAPTPVPIIREAIGTLDSSTKGTDDKSSYTTSTANATNVQQQMTQNQAPPEESFISIETPATNNFFSPESNQNQQQQQQHGGLVRKLLESKREFQVNGEEESGVIGGTGQSLQVQRLKERQETERQVNQLRNSIQELCRNTFPLSKTMDYLQEDIDSMGREWDYWRGQVDSLTSSYEKEQRESLRVLEPLALQVSKLRSSVNALTIQVREKKSSVLNHEGLINKLLLNMATTTSVEQ